MITTLFRTTISFLCFVVLFHVEIANAITGQELVEATGIQGGLIVHLGCGDGKLTADLKVNDRYVVHGLDTDDTVISAAREYIHSRGIYGDVSVDRFDGSQLPYADNLVNLVISENIGDVPISEILRVLCPKGVAYIKRNGEWHKTVKPRPTTIDDWTHFLHDAGNNAVANDSVVGPPRTLQWVAAPLWLRSHETPSGIQAQVCSEGRLYYIFDEGLIGITDERLPDRWSIICRDAFNGKQLWKRPIEPWGWREFARSKWEGQDWLVVRGGRVAFPDENQYHMVVDGDLLYATLGYNAPLSILDAATGEVLHTVEDTEGVNEIRVSDGIVLTYLKDSDTGPKKRRGETDAVDSEIAAIDGETGKILWRKPSGVIRSLSLAIDQGRIFYIRGNDLICFNLKNGDELWQVEHKVKNPSTLVAVNGIVYVKKNVVSAFDGSNGDLLWSHKALNDSGYAQVDLFVANGLVWSGMSAVDENMKSVNKSAHAIAVGYDPITGIPKKNIHVPNLRSPEHHHRCYRNKATDRFMISGLEGAEFMDLRSDGHSQNNWLRGACKLGIMPCNGMLYVPPDQCFCQPGAKLLGYTAVGPESTSPEQEIPDHSRLEKGPAYNSISNKMKTPSQLEWPTFRHDSARSGFTKATVPPHVESDWEMKLGSSLTAPVAANGRVYVAIRDTHTLYALDMKTGEKEWSYTTGGRIDSPPTIYKGRVLFGSADGKVYCLRESDGKPAWKFMAAPYERRIGFFGQVESAWPVHGSVLVHNDVAYFTAGRNSYLDGGIRLYGLDPVTGEILHKGLIEGPHPEDKGERDVSFYVTGANSEVLVSEGGYLYMRQKKLTPELEEIQPEILSSKGECDMGLHIFSTAGLLDGSWYNRTFWMYSNRWPGFQLANQAPKNGQLLVVGENNTYAVKVFYHRNTHSPMFFPGTKGYLIFADHNGTEPQIVGEEGAKEPVEWLPQSDYSRGPGRERRALGSHAFGDDKMIGYTRAEAPLWKQWVDIRVRAMVKANDILFIAGPPDVFDEEDPFAAFEGRKGARLAALSTEDGKILNDIKLESPPVFDGMIAVQDRLIISLRNGSLICVSKSKL